MKINGMGDAIRRWSKFIEIESYCRDIYVLLPEPNV